VVEGVHKGDSDSMCNRHVRCKDSTIVSKAKVAEKKKKTIKRREMDGFVSRESGEGNSIAEVCNLHLNDIQKKVRRVKREGRNTATTKSLLREMKKTWDGNREANSFTPGQELAKRQPSDDQKKEKARQTQKKKRGS